MDNFINKKYANVPRQLLPKYYRINGAIYLVNRFELDKDNTFYDRCYAYVMPRERSVDIDIDMDFTIAEHFMKQSAK